MKTTEQRLAAFPYQVHFEQVDETYDDGYLIEVFNWIYDHGPASADWFVDQKQDGNKMTVMVPPGFPNSPPRPFPRKTHSFTFAFMHRRDAALFKLMWKPQ